MGGTDPESRNPTYFPSPERNPWFRWVIDISVLSRIGLPDLRHTNASNAVKAGVPTSVASERLGHASPEFTLPRYSRGSVASVILDKAA